MAVWNAQNQKANIGLFELEPHSQSKRNVYPHLSHGASAFSAGSWQKIRRGLKLSTREIQIVQGIFDDKLEYSIAKDLGISINTVRTELRRLRRKLNAPNRVALVLCVLEEFLRLQCLTAGGLSALTLVFCVLEEFLRQANC